MDPRSIPGIVCLASVLSLAPAAAQEKVDTLPRELPPPTPLVESAPTNDLPCPPTVEKTYCHTKYHLLTEETMKVLPNAALREVTDYVPFSDVQVEYKEEKRSVTVLVLKPRAVDQVVHSVAMVPELTVDPCTGCSRLEYKQVPVCKTIKVQVFEQVPETRDYVIRVPVLQPVEKQLQVRRFLLDTTPRPAIVRRQQLLQIPTEARVEVPLCPTPAPAPSTEPSGLQPQERP